MRQLTALLPTALVLALGPVLALGLGAAAHAQPPTDLRWQLVKAEIQVRASEGGRYVVESFLDFAPPPTAHRDFDPGGLDFWFHGDPKKQRLEVFTETVNGRDVERVVAVEPDGRATRVLLRIEPDLRTAPLSVHLVVTLARNRGRVALPVSKPNEGAEVVIHRPDAVVERPAKLPASLVVNAKEAEGPGLPLLQVAIVACFVGTIIFVIVILRGRPPE